MGQWNDGFTDVEDDAVCQFILHAAPRRNEAYKRIIGDGEIAGLREFVRAYREYAIVRCIIHFASDMDRLVQTKKDIVDVISRVEDVELRILLEQRYLCGATWEEITMNLYHNRRWVFRLHDKALDAVQQILDGGERSH